MNHTEFGAGGTPPIDAEVLRYENPIRDAIAQATIAAADAQIAAARGEQPETTALPEPGALRGDSPLAKGEAVDKEIK